MLNEDGSGDAYYNYYDDTPITQRITTEPILSFTGIERVEFNDVHQTLDRGSDHGRWAAFDLEGVGNGVHIVDNVEHEATFNGSTYKLLYGIFLMTRHRLQLRWVGIF